ncbi:MAG TPA: hypothetical protein VFQ35_16885 [Polyangiaceae bacterium]|nr:hypothetical protein [Polyangiaceae bacterium]
MAEELGTKSGALKVDAANELPSGTRRGFLQLGAVVVAGLVDGCSGGTPEPGGEGGSPGKGGATGSGGGASGGAASGGTSNGQGGAASGGTSNGQGGASMGGRQSSGGGTSTGTGGSTSSSSGGTTSSSGGTSSGVTGGTSPGGGATSGGSTGAGGGGSSGGGWKESNTGGCTLGTVPSPTSNAKLPDPFKFISGQRLAKKEDWECLRAELSAMAQQCIYGPKMPPPDKLTATFSGGTVTVNMTVGSTMKSFTFKISGAGSQSSPAPVLITCGGSSLPKLSGVAQIDMSNNSFSSEKDNSGMVKDLYGSKAAKSGALISWAWGCSRIIDALELLPEAGVDVKRIAVTGCSRNGKGALAMGAFDERVALTIPQEGGSGGPALWRVSEKEKAMGQNIQESGEIVGEAKWQGGDFPTYANGKNAMLLADQHTVIALCAPRAVLVIDNDIDWLGPVACYGGGKAASKVYEGLGIKDRCGVSVAANHSHCQFPSAQQKFLDAFVNRFLKGMKVDTSGVDDFHGTNSKLKTFDESMWIDWTVPTLSGSLSWDPFA